ncbi:hypothetical protein C0J52_13039, partial [Blattella germanica]
NPRLYSGIEGRAAVENLKFPTISLLNTALHDQCPLRFDQVPRCPDTSGRYRTADGRCNNPAHPWWGASMMPLHRFLPSNYRDASAQTRGYNGTVPKCCVDGGRDFQPSDRAKR